MCLSWVSVLECIKIAELHGHLQSRGLIVNQTIVAVKHPLKLLMFEEETNCTVIWHTICHEDAESLKVHSDKERKRWCDY